MGWQGGKFKKDEETPLKTDFLIVDECSMLDINLTASLLKATPQNAQVLFIGDSDQLPSVGAGNVLKDIIASEAVPCFRLTKIFRQAQESLIIKYAHQINHGDLPWIKSPFKKPEIWTDKTDCLFFDSDEATQEQISFVARVKRFYDFQTELKEKNSEDLYEFRVQEPVVPYETEITIPKKFQHVNLDQIYQAETKIEELVSVLKKSPSLVIITLQSFCFGCRSKTLPGMDSQILREL